MPLLIGGNGERVLRYGAQHADRVGIAGLERTLADGHSHAVDWSEAALARTVEVIGSSAAAVGRDPRIEALVQHVEITDDAEAAAARLVPHVAGATHERTWGITHYVVRAPAMEDAVRVLETMTQD